MNAVQNFRELGVEVRRQGPELRLVWHREPTPELRELVKAHKQELLDELAASLVEFSMKAPSDPEALSEFFDFTKEERHWFFSCRAALLEEGAERPRAERDAAAAVLQHRRLTTPLPSWVVKALLKERQSKQ